MVGDRDGVVAAAQHDRMLQDTRGTDVAGERRGVRAALGEGDEAEDEVEEVFTERRGEGGGCEGGILRRARAVPAAAAAAAAGSSPSNSTNKKKMKSKKKKKKETTKKSNDDKSGSTSMTIKGSKRSGTFKN